MFVGAFIIFNTFSITVAQRTTRVRRCCAPSGPRGGRCCARSSLEALIVGLERSVLGLLAGIVAAKGINALFRAFGADLPLRGPCCYRAP